ncbi:MAG: molybdopterin cofactor-binding domain-containing protein [Xanthobacter sp.]
MSDTASVPGQGSLALFDDLPSGRATLLRIDAEGVATGFNGHVDLGTGIETALAQIVAEELDFPLSAVRIVLGDTASTPDQGPTIASETIQVAAIPLRLAAAYARQILIADAALRLNVAPEDIHLAEGVFRAGDQSITPAELVAGQTRELRLDRTVLVKDPRDYHIVGRKTGRRDLGPKVTGAFTYIHDQQIDGMLHGHVIRPPYAGRDSGDFIGRSLLSVDESSISGMPGFVAVVRQADFLGVVAHTAEQARRMAEALDVRWNLPPELPDMADLPGTLRSQPSTVRLLDNRGDFARGMAESRLRLERTYVWPYHEHGSIGPSCAIADWNKGSPIVWSGTQNPHMLQGDLAVLMDLPAQAIEIRRLQAAGCYGRNCADDVCGDALLLSQAVGHPVRVQLTRAQEHLWEPKGAAQLMDAAGGLSQDGFLHAYKLETWYPSNRGPNLALLLTGRVSPEPRPADMGDRTSIPPYRIPNTHITVHDMAPIVRAAWMRGVSALPNTFAHESFMDEMAWEAKEDPVAFRLKHLDDARKAGLVRRTAEAAGWSAHTGPRLRREGRMAFGQGFAFATYVHGTFPGTAAASAAWVCDVSVDTETGEVHLSRVFVGQDQGLVINPDGVRQQIHGCVVQTASRTLRENVTFDSITPTAQSWATYPIQTFPEVPQIETLLVERPGDPPLGVGESAAVPAAAAIANAIFDATGVRMRAAPFTPEKVRAALEEAGLRQPQSLPPAHTQPKRTRSGWFRNLGMARLLGAAGALGGAVTLGAMALPIARALPPTPAPAASSFSPELLERGRMVFATGDCAVCHTSDDGIANAGGRPMATPFGTVYTTNLTRDAETGLGLWSYEAFTRAMRQGISRDGKHLYPAFPYTDFAKISEDDMFALYAYLQTLDPVHAPTPKADMLPGVNLRPVNAVWNMLYHSATPFTPDAAQSEVWNRGKYLVEAAGHCGACHTPRNLLGALKGGASAYAGADVHGWWAPALAGQAAGARGWDEDSLFTYMRTGRAPGVAVASGPMADVVHSMNDLPDTDIRAMSVYLASLVAPAASTQAAAHLAVATAASAPTATQAPPLPDAISRIFESACASCHEPAMIDLFTAAQESLTRSAAVRAPSPEALRTVIREGIMAPQGMDLRDMPAFGQELSETELDQLANYVRARYAPDLPAWK